MLRGKAAVVAACNARCLNPGAHATKMGSFSPHPSSIIFLQQLLPCKTAHISQELSDKNI